MKVQESIKYSVVECVSLSGYRVGKLYGTHERYLPSALIFQHSRASQTSGRSYQPNKCSWALSIAAIAVAVET